MMILSYFLVSKFFSCFQVPFLISKFSILFFSCFQIDNNVSKFISKLVITINLVFWRPLPKRRRLFHFSSTWENTSSLFHVFRFLLLHIFEYLGDLFVFTIQVLHLFPAKLRNNFSLKRRTRRRISGRKSVRIADFEPSNIVRRYSVDLLNEDRENDPQKMDLKVWHRYVIPWRNIIK